MSTSHSDDDKLLSKHYYLTSPISKRDGVLQCYVVRVKSMNYDNCDTYFLHLEDGDMLLLSAKRNFSYCANISYVISKDPNEFDIRSDAYIGQVRSDMFRTDFVIEFNDIYEQHLKACSMGSINYLGVDLLRGYLGPRKLEVMIPNIQDTRLLDQATSSMLQHQSTDKAAYEFNLEAKELYLINKVPRFNSNIGAYVLNFNGRVTIASVKNFQLIHPKQTNNVMLQFGRVGTDTFTLDVQYPLSIYQGFAIALTSFSF